MDALTRTAVTGTSREAAPARDLPTDDLLQGAKTSPERDLLLRAGMQAVYRTAGRRAETGAKAPHPAPDETLPACSARAADIVRQLLAGRRYDILREALERLRLAGLRLPRALLPAALDVEQGELRTAAVAVLGERGLWLAGLNPAWGWAAVGGKEHDDEIIWEEGALSERLEALRRVRRRDPGSGLGWIEEVWQSEKADARVAMVAALEIGLSSDDEPFLEQALDDRSLRVREATVPLLARIQGSAYGERAKARADSVLVRYEPPASGLRGAAAGLTGRGRAGELVVEPPEHYGAEWKRDLPGDVPHHGVGERAWLISQALSVVPPEHWKRRFGAEPSDLVAAVRGDWEMASLAGWCRASALHGDSSWAMPLWRACYRLPHDDLEGWLTWQTSLSVAGLLSQSDVASDIGRLPRNGEMPFRLSSTLQAISVPWQSEMSEAFLRGLRKRISGVCAYGPAQGEEPWVTALAHASMSLASESLKQATGFRESLERCPDLPDHAVRRWGPELEKFEVTLELRRKLVEEIPL